LKRLLCSLAAGLLAFASSLGAATIPVPADQPTIQAGLDSAVAGDTVLVAPGAYLEQLDFNGKAIVLMSSAGAFATSLQPRHPDSTSVSIISGEAAGTEISGFTFRGGNRQAVIRLGGGASVTITDCRFTEAIGPEPVIRCDSARVILSDNVFFDNQALACIGIYADTVALYNNTYVGNNRGVFALGGHADIRNCIFADHSGYALSGDSIASNYNVFQNNTPNFAYGAASGTNDLFADPGFTTREYRDYTLRDTSICIDAGDPDSLFLDPDSSRADIGAYPFGAILTVQPVAVDFTLASETLTRVVAAQPTFTWQFYDSVGVATGYEIEVGSDNDWSTAELWQPGQQFVADSSVAYAGISLTDSTAYYARVRLNNGTAWGDWTTFGFATNTPPEPPSAVLPLEGDSLSVFNAVLTVANGDDVDNDSLSYDFFVYSDSTLSSIAAQDTLVTQQSIQTSSAALAGLTPGATYWWRARVTDGYEYSVWTDSQAFSVFQAPRTLRVPSDYGTIGAAVAAAADLDTILVADGVYSGPGNRRVNLGSKQLQLLSENGPAATIIDCFDSSGTTHWALRAANGQNSTTLIRGFTIRNAEQGVLLEAEPDLHDLVFEDNTTGCLVFGAIELQFDSCEWRNNGTGVSVEGGAEVTISESRLAGNTIGVFSDESTVALAQAMVDSNGYGLRLYRTTARLDTCTLTGNQHGLKSSTGSQSGLAELFGCTLIDNDLAVMGDVTIDSSSITGGTIGVETIFPDRATLRHTTLTGITGTVFQQLYNRTGPPPGGLAVLQQDPGLALLGCEIAGNPGQVGNIQSGQDGDYNIVSIDSCTIHHNGGGFTIEGELQLSWTLYAANAGPLTFTVNDWATDTSVLSQNTVVENSGDGLVVMSETGLVNVVRSIIADNGGVGLTYTTADSSRGDISCNNVFSNLGGNYAGIPNQTDSSGNVSSLPRFCKVDSLDFSIKDISLCAPGNNSCDTLIGAYQLGCFNELPQVTSPDTVTVLEDSLLVYPVTFTDSDGPDTLRSITGIPSWLTLANDTLSGVPTEGIGDTSFVIAVSDGFAADTVEVIVDVTPVNDPPVLDSISDVQVIELDTLTLVFSAADVDSDSLTLSVTPLPAGAMVVDSGNGTAVLTWRPDTSTAGLYSVFCIADDGPAADTEIVAIRVQSRRPTVTALTIDGLNSPQRLVSHTPEMCWRYTDSAYGFAQTEYELAVGIDTNWDFAEIWNPAPEATADTCVTFGGAPLEDGATYFVRVRARNDTLYSDWIETSFRMNSTPTAPMLRTPAAGGGVLELQPTFVVDNGSDADSDSLTYDFEIYADSLLDSLVALETAIPETPDSSLVTLSTPLEENGIYWWRVRATDGYEYSSWTDSAMFFINLGPQPPQPFVVHEETPDSGQTQYDMLPTYNWSPAVDPDPGDSVLYRLMFSRDGFAADTLRYDSIPDTTFTLPDSLAFDTQYEWRLEAFDATGLITEASDRLYFYTWTLGDINDNHYVNLTDLTRLVNALFVTFEPIEPSFVADLNGSCTVNLTDVNRLVNYLFLDGEPPLPGCVETPTGPGPATR